MSESLSKYFFQLDNGDHFGYALLVSDDAAKSLCQDISDRSGDHVTCVRMIVDCHPSQVRAAEQRNEAVAEAQKCPFCSGLGFVELNNGLYPCNACDGTGISKRA